MIQRIREEMIRKNGEEGAKGIKLVSSDTGETGQPCFLAFF
jgi:hypothetical protein